MKSKSLALTALAATVAIMSATPAYAGQSNLMTGMCRSISPTLSQCFGTFAGIRAQTADPSRSVSFFIDGRGNRGFSMMFNGIVRNCGAHPSLNEVWNAALSSVGHFFVEYDPTTGVCTNATVSHSSLSKNASAL